MGAVEISGLNELIYKINDCKNLTKIKEVVRANGADLNDKMKGMHLTLNMVLDSWKPSHFASRPSTNRKRSSFPI